MPIALDALVGNFNSKQKEAYDYDGDCVVLAGPGSGKTRVLVSKVARLFTQRANGPRGVACVTFNNEAVREMRKRLGELGLKPSKRLFVGTVHSFCLSCVVAPFGSLFREDLVGKVTIAGARQREGALQGALDSLGIRDRPVNWRTNLDRFRRTHPIRDGGAWDQNLQMVQLTQRYEEILHQQGVLDFDDMVLIALDLIRRHEFVRSAIEARFPFLVVDEYQDLGYPLHLIVRLLMEHTNIEVFAVGDPDQSIYGFTGADPSYLRGLAQDAAVNTVELEMNYRSAQRIIDGAQIALAPEEPRNYRSTREGVNGQLFFLECPNGLDEQAQLIANRIIPALRRRNIPMDQIAILYIDRWDQSVLSRALDDEGIQYAGERDQRYPRTPFTRWLEDIAIWCSLFPNTQTGPGFSELLNWYLRLRADAGISVNPEDLATRSEFFDTLRHLAIPDIDLVDWLEQLDSSLDIKECLGSINFDGDDLVNWNDIKRSCQEDGSLYGYKLDDFARGGGRSDTVTLTTLHSSKGLEYEVVIMPGLEEGRLPGYRAKSPEALAEARRVFYVGMTRAKDTVFLMYSGWYETRFRKWENGPSSFVRELQDQVDR
ncbi:MAG: ATP-dependent helicase [Dehalococcoidia bacterium]|nr:ATP-dependent helicase [Dehalococcoidia bacterium]